MEHSGIVAIFFCDVITVFRMYDGAADCTLQAIYSGDGEWYEATVKGVSDTGDFVVSFDAYDHEEAVGTPLNRAHGKPGCERLQELMWPFPRLASCVSLEGV